MPALLSATARGLRQRGLQIFGLYPAFQLLELLGSGSGCG
jgi:hypothetical protein